MPLITSPGRTRQVDVPDALRPELAGDVLRGVDGHLDVDVEEAETDEGMEVVDRVELAGAELQVGHRPGDEQGGERGRGAEELVAARLDRVRTEGNEGAVPAGNLAGSPFLFAVVVSGRGSRCSKLR